MSTDAPEASADAAAPAEPTLGTAIARLSHRLTDPDANKGELADLRRLAAKNEKNRAFWRVLTKEVPEKFSGGQDRENIWASLFAAYALLAPLGNGRGTGLGTALAETRDNETHEKKPSYSEPRLLRLLRSDKDQIHDELITAARWLAAHGRTADWLEIARFAFSRLNEDGDSDHYTARTIARDYFSAIARSEGTKS